MAAIGLAAALVCAPACSRSPSESPPESPASDSQTAPKPATGAERPSDGSTPAPADAPSADAQPDAPQRSSEPTFVELLPGVRVDRDQRIVEFDGYVPINVNDRDTLGDYLVVFLECIVTTPTAEKDHETLVVADIRPSNLHAALLAVGLDPGEPGNWLWDGEQVQRIPARGDEVDVMLRWEDAGGATIERDPRQLIINEKTGEHFGGSDWVFAGSIEEAPPPPDLPDPDAEAPTGPIYAADATGLLVGLTTFGTEVVAWREVISHAAEVDTPVWIADRTTTPPYETKVTVRLRPAAE